MDQKQQQADAVIEPVHGLTDGPEHGSQDPQGRTQDPETLIGNLDMVGPADAGRLHSPIESASQPAKETDKEKLDAILAIRIPVIVKMAEKKMTVSEVLKLNLHSVIQFDKDAYQHIDLMVNNSTIGLGRPIKIGESFGLRVTEIADITQTIKSLGPNQQVADTSKIDCASQHSRPATDKDS